VVEVLVAPWGINGSSARVTLGDLGDLGDLGAGSGAGVFGAVFGGSLAVLEDRKNSQKSRRIKRIPTPKIIIQVMEEIRRV